MHVSNRPDLTVLRDVEMLCLLVDAGGMVHWANKTALAEAPAGRPLIHLLHLVHPVDRELLGMLVRQAALTGSAEGTVRWRSGPPGGGRFVRLVVSRAGEVLPPDLLPGLDETGNGLLLVQGWDVTALQLRMRQLQTTRLRDDLTGLPNRLTFDVRLEHDLTRSRRSGLNVAVLWAGVEGWAEVREAHGSAASDRLLVELADRLGQNLRPGDTLARVGAHEFAVICPDLNTMDQALAVLDRLRSASVVPLGDQDGRLPVRLAVGAAMAVDDDRDDDGRRLLERAHQVYSCSPGARPARHRADGPVPRQPGQIDPDVAGD
jgi:diguanylate cyclase (GGDEF)-like protein